MGKIKNLKEGGEIHFSKPEVGLPTYPQKPYPGHPVSEATCSPPDGENTGCDAWKRCNTQGEGPYSVVYQNLSKGTKNSCHCRLWHYRLKRKVDRYQPVDDPWVDMVESIAIDPRDISKGTRVRRYSYFIENARLPVPGAKTRDIGEYEDEGLSSAAELKTDASHLVPHTNLPEPSPEPEAELPPELTKPLEIHDERTSTATNTTTTRRKKKK